MTPILSEPILSEEDHRVWDMWVRTAAVHSRTLAFGRRVESARRVVDQCLSATPNTTISWSGGKDSTVMTYLVCVEMGARVHVFSEKDDLDFPGEIEYVRSLGVLWGLDLTVLFPPVSSLGLVKDRSRTMAIGDEIHSRSAELSKTCFYSVMREANRPYDTVMLGLRSEESPIRRNVRKYRGRYYPLVDGTYRALPIADWVGIDVYAYAVLHGIELLPLYKCLAMMHRNEPWRLRKSWWLPGGNASYGQVGWLKRYYPSLYRTYCAIFPNASSFT